MPPDTVPAADHDGHWKEALDAYFAPCLELFWPALHARVDWSITPVFRDKELQQFAGAPRETGAPGRGGRRRYVDKLVEVTLIGGTAVHLLIHVEVQARLDADFLQRMYAYHCLLWTNSARQGRELIHVAILTRSRGGAPLQTYRSAPLDGLMGDAALRFPVVHLRAWRPATLTEVARRNPFAVVALAEIEAAGARQPLDRFERKKQLLRLLYENGYGGDDVNRLFAFIDGVLTLPAELAWRFNEAVDEIEGEYDVAYVTSVERIGIQKGLAQGREEGRRQGRQEGRQDGIRQVLLAQLERRFGALPESVRKRVAEATAETLQVWSLRLLDADALDDVFRAPG